MHTYYKTKAQDSFRTKLYLFLYHYVSTGGNTAFDIESFNRFQISPELVYEYTTLYWQSNYDDKIRDMTIREIYKQIDYISKERSAIIREWELYYVQSVFPIRFPVQEFQKLTVQDTCYYCGITKDEINALADARRLYKKKDRGWNLEIDRLDSNSEYSPDNCVMCCYWCNNAKTDEFTPTEFKEIAKAIRKVWDRRLRMDRFVDGGDSITVIKGGVNCCGDRLSVSVGSVEIPAAILEKFNKCTHIPCCCIRRSATHEGYLVR